MVWPTLAASEAREAITFAHSIGVPMRPRGIHSDEIAQNYIHEVGDTPLWLELKLPSELILVHSRAFVTRAAQILKHFNCLLRGNITRVQFQRCSKLLFSIFDIPGAAVHQP